MLYGQLKEGQCTQGGQKKRYNDKIKTHWRKCHFSMDNCQEMALDTNLWRRMVCDGTVLHEKDNYNHDSNQLQLLL